jgi:hypothetical protein
VHAHDTVDGALDRGLDLGIRAVRGSGSTRSRVDDRQHRERCEMQDVAFAEGDPEAIERDRADHVRDARPFARCLVGLAIERMAARYAIGGDRDTDHDIGGRELVHAVAERREPLDEVTPRRDERLGVEPEPLRRTAHGGRVERLVVDLVVHDAADEASARELGSVEEDDGRLPSVREARAAQQPADPAKVALDRGGRHVHLERGLEHVDAVVRLEQAPDEQARSFARRVPAGFDAVDLDRRGVMRRTISEGPRLDRLGRDLVDRGDVAPDASRRHPEVVGEVSGSDPIRAAYQDAEHPRLSFVGHGSSQPSLLHRFPHAPERHLHCGEADPRPG